MNWESLHTFALVAEAGSLNSAANRLAINPSTAYRRLVALEDQLGGELFVRSDGQYLLTPLGERMMARVGTMHSEFLELERDVTSERPSIEGRVRVTTTDSLALGLLSNLLSEFRDAYPKVRVDLSVTNRQMRLDLREADIAVRPTTGPDARAVGRKLGALDFSVVASEDWCSAHPEAVADPFAHAEFVSLDDSLFVPTFMKVFRKQLASEEQIIFRSDSLAVVMGWIEAGVAPGFVPWALLPSLKGLRRLTVSQSIPKFAVWALAHPDMIRHLPVRVMLDFLYDRIPSLLDNRHSK